MCADLYDHLYLLWDPFATRPWRLTLHPDSPTHGEQWRSYLAGTSKPEGNLKLTVGSGGHPTDLMHSEMASVHVISQRVADMLKENSFTGWGTYPVEIHDRAGNVLLDYYGLAVTGRAGKWRVEPSSRVLLPPKAPRGIPYAAYIGLFFDESAWDHSDIFLIKDSGYIIVKETVMRAFKRAHISNVRWKVLSQLELNAFLIEGSAESNNIS